MNLKIFLWIVSLSFAANVRAQESTRPVDGLRSNPPKTFALIGARVIVEPEKEIEDATIVIRDGLIEEIGSQLEIPPDAKRWELSGKFIYPGFMDAYTEFAIKADRSETGYWNPLVTPERSANSYYKPESDQNSEFRKQGFTSRLVAPDAGLIRGMSALVSTSASSAERRVLKKDVALHIKLSARLGGREFPQSPMGAVALARQAFYDAQWHHASWRTFQTQNGLTRPEQNDSLDILQQFFAPEKKVFFIATDEQYAIRADIFAREFNLNALIVGSGHEYRRLTAIQEMARPIVVPLAFPKAPLVATTDHANRVTLEQLMHWDHAPENPKRLDEAGVEIALTTYGLKKKTDFLKALRTAVDRGLHRQSALRALTTTPARWFGVENSLGRLKKGFHANLFVTDGDIFEDKTKVLETWIDGERYPNQKPNPRIPVGTWKSNSKHAFQLVITKENDKYSASIQFSSVDKIELQKLNLDANELAAVFDSHKVALDGKARISATVVGLQQEHPKLVGVISWPNGDLESFAANRISDDSAASSEENQAENKVVENSKADNQQEKPTERNPAASYPVNFPLGAFGVEKPLSSQGSFVFTHATIWTCAKPGIIKDGQIVVVDGVITAVGKKLEHPADAVMIDCQGKHLTPGIIDCHSHMATDGGVNEGSQAITAEVRIGDFIDARDINIYRQLAGGVTTSNILHGSANPIGGQNQVIKLRWGSLPEDLKFKQAPAGIKFALGENVKRSNSSQSSNRYPQTRMGVEQLIRDAFLTARQYRDRWIDWRNDRKGLPPRRDLELDALVEVLEQKRWIHCHSYRQDEILALLRTLESFHIQIGTLQHILEGYKIADAMRNHGAMGSSFSDWWAYKFEVYDAIPYNGTLMHQVGVNVSFNSDDRELARHLNHEAAKAVKYGQLEPEEALKFVTSNPAKQLRISHLVGSIEVGKHADLVLWSGDPLSTFSRCEQTWIDGIRYFDLQTDRNRRPHWKEMRNSLIQKILNSNSEMEKPGERKVEERDLWPREDIYCRHRNLQTNR